MHRTAGRRDGPTCVRDPEDDLLRALYREHADALLRFVVRLTAGDRQRAEDIVQETLLRAWRNADRFDPQAVGALRPWLFTVARRIAIDEHRSASARAPETYGQDLDEVRPVHVSQGDETEHVLATVVVTDALRGLSPAHREILVETYLRDRTVNEAADLLGLPIGTAKSRVYYALRQLRAALAAPVITHETPDRFDSSATTLCEFVHCGNIQSIHGSHPYNVTEYENAPRRTTWQQPDSPSSLPAARRRPRSPA